ncbi:MAG: TolC family protein [Candidatus Binataceae bacterium]|nr:TolC family protein [Candidatus Binataceae bacterium]
MICIAEVVMKAAMKTISYRSYGYRALLAGLLMAIAGNAMAQAQPNVSNPMPQSVTPPLSLKPRTTFPKTHTVSPVRHFDNDKLRIGNELDLLIKEAIAQNPDLAAARSNLVAAMARVPVAAMPPDPQIGFRLKDMPTTFSWTRENATEKQVVVQQQYPFPGKLNLRKEIQGKLADITREQLHAITLHLITQVRSAFADLFLVDKSVELAMEQGAMLRDLNEIATEKYKLGPGLQQDILDADVALARTDATLAEFARKRMSREIQLATLLNRDRVSLPPMGVLPDAGLKHSPLELEQIAIEMNPDILARQHDVQREQLSLSLARRGMLPDMSFQLEYGDRQDNLLTGTAGKRNFRPDMLGAVVLFSAPVFYYWKQNEQVIEAEANLARSRFQLAATREQTVGSLRDQVARLSQHEQVALSLKEQVIPLAQTALASAMSAYQVGKVDFVTLLTAQGKLDEFKNLYWQNEAERFKDLALIDEDTGAALTEFGWTQ